MFIKKYQERLWKIVELPELFINSMNMYNVFQFISNDDLDGLVNYLVGAVEKLQLIGADFAVISANTPHIVFDQVRGKVYLPFICIVETTCNKAARINARRLGLLGTKFTMENDFFHRPFERVGIE